MTDLKVRTLCPCGVPVFKGDDGVCNSCVRRHRAELLEAAKEEAV